MASKSGVKDKKKFNAAYLSKSRIEQDKLNKKLMQKRVQQFG
jgi:hypothetical protein